MFLSSIRIARSLGRSGGTSLLPEAVAELLRRRVTELAGLALVLVGCLLGAVLASYREADPSWNTAAGTTGPAGIDEVNNLLGVAGAHAADLLMQSLGLASWLLVAIMVGWGLRVARHRALPRLPVRVLLALIAAVFAAIAMASLPTLTQWPLGSHPGGSIGLILLNLVVHLLRGLFGVHNSTAGAASFAAVVAVVGAARAIGPSLRDRSAWGRLFGALFGAGSGLAGLSGRAVHGIGRLAGRVAAGLHREPTADAAADPTGEVQAATSPTAAAGPTIAGAALRPVPVFQRNPPSFADAPSSPAAPTPPAQSSARPAVAEAFAAGETSGDLRPRPGPVVTAKPKPVEPGRRATAARQPSLAFDTPDDVQYQLPPLELLQAPAAVARPASLDESALRRNAEILEGVLGDFGVRGAIQTVHPGPVVTLYELEPAPGTKSSRVIGLADDIARSMSAVSVRVAVVPGRNVIGIELPNARREIVLLRELLACDAFDRSPAKLALVLGKDIGGGPVIADLARFPHLLVAGTTGSGKSVAINTMILSLLYRLSPDRCRFIMVDPKMLELSVYEGIPHLLSPVVTDPKLAVVALKWAVREMENRYRAMSKLGVRNIEGYNIRLKDARQNGEALTRRVQTGFDPDTGKPLFEEHPLDLTELPYIVVIVDEMADLMLVAGKEIEAVIQRLAQMARAAGIHLIMATQRPSVDVITGTIKANFPTRISFQVTSKIDSRTILGEQGAEQLLGQGDMLYMAGGGRVTRVHGPFVRDDEVEAVVRFLKTQGEPDYVDAVLEDQDDDEGGGGAARTGGDDDPSGGGGDPYDQAVAVVTRERKASTSFIQRQLRIGYNSAARLIERMEKEGVVSKPNHAGKREVLVRGLEDD
ncbi:MAG: cell division protein FtsK [Azospirillum sp.]|nr:cell division protein FtsK [Azospirillum sp.]